jgi:bacillithiol system protein YtxJ
LKNGQTAFVVGYISNPIPRCERRQNVASCVIYTDVMTDVGFCDNDRQSTLIIVFLQKKVMGIFDKLFGGNENFQSEDTAIQIPWKQLTSIDQLDSLVEESKSIPVAIFKHSTSCGISRMVIKQFESQYDFEVAQLQPYYLDLKAYRAVSNEIAARFQIMHESPQMLLIKNGTLVYADSHGAISVGALKAKI